MEILIVSGISGAGKSRVADVLEDMGFYCIDNMPAVLIPKFAELFHEISDKYKRAALVVDVRGSDSFAELFSAADEIAGMGHSYKIVFVEAQPEIIIKRFKETRRKHPLDVGNEPIEKLVRLESDILDPVRSRADYILDTTSYSTSVLRQRVLELFSEDKDKKPMTVTVQSFGFKYGIPIDADLVIDVRFLPNPYYVDELRSKTGLDPDVYEYVFKWEQTAKLVGHFSSLIKFLLPEYVREGKTALNLSIGCTGGRHRSVALTEYFRKYISSEGYYASASHRELSIRPSRRLSDLEEIC